MSITKILKNTITSNGQSYSNYIYTFSMDQFNDGLDPLDLLPYQIETNKAFQHYLNGSNEVLEIFKNALLLEKNYITIMNVCVISLAQRQFEDLELLVQQANIHSQGESHHIIFLVELYVLLHDYDNAIKQLVELLIHQEQHDVVSALSKVVFNSKLYSIEHLSNLVQDRQILEQLIKINKQCFISHYSYDSQNKCQTKNTLTFNLDLDLSIQEQLSQEQFNNTLSYQTQKTDQLSFISQTQDNNFNQQSLLDFTFIDIVLDNPNLFSFQFRVPYMIGSYDIKKMNKLQSKIAEGGFGEVYVAKNLKTNEIHALKIIKQQEDENVNLILQETIIQDKIQKLNSKLFLNLKPQVYLKKQSRFVDIFIPLELGQFNLYEYTQEHQINEQEYNQFYNLFIDYIVTLHSNKYAHRDIKPQNILFIKDVGWKLADFGESLKYDNVEDIYKIRGTLPFLPFNLRQQSKKQSQVKQNLLYNDLYAVVCTLVMIKNPNFDSKELTNFMDKAQLDSQLQQLLYNFDNIELLDKIKINQLQQIETKFIIKNYIQDQECQWDCYEKLRFYKEQQKQLDNDFRQQLDELLGFYKQKQQQNNQIYLSLLISQSFPFEIDKFQNIIVFNFQRHLLADIQSINFTSHSYYHTIIDYFLTIKLYDLAIRICDQLMSLEYALIFHLLKIQALILLDKLKQAKEELELIYRYFISTQSYSLQEQMLFFHLYLKLHNQVPQIKIDKIFKNGLIEGFNQIKSTQHQAKVDLNSPINAEIVNEKQHLKLRLDALFEFVYQDPYNINEKICQETVKMFGNQFIDNGQLINCEEFISLIKENLNFWSSVYITKIHIIAIGLNYLLNYYGKYHIAINIGQYFHNILKNIGSCESILDHYQHLLNTYLIVYELYNKKPANLIDLNRCLQEVQYLSLFDQIYLKLKTTTIWYIIVSKFEQTLISQEVNEQFKQLITQLLDLLKPFLNQKDTNHNQRKKLRHFLTYMIINFLHFLNLLQIVKKMFKVLLYINQGQKTFIGQYSTALLITKQYKMNTQLFNQYITHQNKIPFKIEKFCYNNLINIYLSPIKVLNILNMYGLNKKQSLLASLEYNFNNDLRYFLYSHQEFRLTKLSQKLKQKIDQINIKYQYFKL